MKRILYFLLIMIFSLALQGAKAWAINYTYNVDSQVDGVSDINNPPPTDECKAHLPDPNDPNNPNLFIVRCTLREAFNQANKIKGGDTAVINLPTGDYPLDAMFGVLSVTNTNPITIQGDGPSMSRIAAPANMNIFNVADTAKLTLDGVQLKNGKGTNGGAIVNSGTLTINNSKLVNNTASGNGGAIYNISTKALTITDTEFSGNKAGKGGAIYNDGGVNGTLTINAGGDYNKRPRFLSNIATADGGAIYSNGGTVTLEGGKHLGQFSNNSATNNGGAVYNTSIMSISGSLLGSYDTDAIAGNTATNGAAIYNKGDLKLFRSTLYGNKATVGAGVYSSEGTAVIENTSILDQNKDNKSSLLVNQINNTMQLVNVTIREDDVAIKPGVPIAIDTKNGTSFNIQSSILDSRCDGTITSTGYTLVPRVLQNPCTYNEANTDILPDQNQILPNVAFYTQIYRLELAKLYPLSVGSVARDAIPLGDCKDYQGNPLTVDQLSYTRQGASQGNCDIGALEMGCGNGVKETNEECDDGDLDNGDGCDSQCKLEGNVDGTATATAGTATSGDTATAGSATAGSATAGSATSGEDGGGCALQTHSETPALMGLAMGMGVLAVLGLRRILGSKSSK